MTKILLSVDSSEFSVGAVNWYLKEFHKDKNELVLLHLIEFPFSAVQPTRAEIMEKLFETAKKDGEVVVGKFQSMLAEAGIKARSIVEFTNKIGEEVVQQARKEEVGYIVMGTRGLGTVRRTIMGSVSDYVLQHSPCPVCVYRKPPQ